MQVLHTLLYLVLSVCALPDVIVKLTDDIVSLENGFVKVVFDRKHPGISSLAGSYQGYGTYTETLAKWGIRLEREDASGTHASTDVSLTQPIGVSVSSNNSAVGSVTIKSIPASSKKYVTEDWTLTLIQGSRSLVLQTTGLLNANVLSKAVRHGIYLTATSVTAFYSGPGGGTVQMKAAKSVGDFFATDAGAPMLQWYSLGGGSACAGTTSAPGQVLLSSESGDPYWSGMQAVLLGSFSPSHMNKWSSGWDTTSEQSLTAGTTWQSTMHLSPNNYNFPAMNVSTGPNWQLKDMGAFLTGIYASPVGCLDTFPNAVTAGVQVGQIGTSIHFPEQGYGGTYNYFDPDNYIGLTAMLFSGNAHLHSQARTVIERSGSFLLPTGQLPHHFVGTKPTYQALSGAVQTGPNMFWILTAFNYVKESGDVAWLKTYMPTLRHALTFLLSMYDPGMDLLKVPGSLMIDVFIRTNYTTDSNAMFVILLREFAGAEGTVGNTTGEAQLITMAAATASAIREHLWDNTSNDHFVTQLNPDGSTRDFVDYDANLIAAAAGVLPRGDARLTNLFARVDNGRCTHARATFVSEKWYGPNDCYKGNVGDSWTTMGRIGWFDALARQYQGQPDDAYTVNSVLLDPLQDDVFQYTWLRERYGCDGKQQLNRTFGYFEYPAVVAMMIRTVRYGIQLGLQQVVIDPLGHKPFQYVLESLEINYSPPTVFSASIPNAVAARTWTARGYAGNAVYNLTSSSCATPPPGQVTASSSGELVIAMPANCTAAAYTLHQ